jgi:hypothetical protein
VSNVYSSKKLYVSKTSVVEMKLIFETNKIKKLKGWHHLHVFVAVDSIRKPRSKYAMLIVRMLLLSTRCT